MAKALLKCHKGLTWLTEKGSFVGEMIILALGVLICADVIMRYLFNSPIVGSYDICCLGLGIITFLGWNVVQGENHHINVTILCDKFPKKVRHVLLGIMNLLTTICCAMMCYGTYLQAVKLTKQVTWSAVLEIPYYPFYFIAAACFAVFTLQLLVDTLMEFVAIGSKELDDVVSQWQSGSTD